MVSDGVRVTADPGRTAASEALDPAGPGHRQPDRDTRTGRNAARLPRRHQRVNVDDGGKDSVDEHALVAAAADR